jgi:hypothetical protein
MDTPTINKGTFRGHRQIEEWTACSSTERSWQQRAAQQNNCLNPFYDFLFRSESGTDDILGSEARL